MAIDKQQLETRVRELAEGLEVPGVLAGVYHEGETHLVAHGVTSVEHPLPVTEDTLFQIASVAKTFTATAIMRLVERGLMALDEPVRTYLPEFKLQDEDVAARVTVGHLLNHTAGWEGDVEGVELGAGDDVLARCAAAMAGLEQVHPLGEVFSYSNSSFALADHLIERVTGKTIERAMQELLLDPLGLDSTLFFLPDVMTRRFMIGHIQQEDDGSIGTARPWSEPRGGGFTMPIGDLLAWARFHTGDGRAASGEQVLATELMQQMREPTFDRQGGSGIGVGWQLSSIDGVRILFHGGSGIGQFTECWLVPERDFAAVVFTNSGPNGMGLNKQFIQWALEAGVGLVEPEPVALRLDAEQAALYAGPYETNVMTCDLVVDGTGLEMTVKVKQSALDDAGEDDPQYPPMRVELLSGDGNRYRILDGPFVGLQGYFTRSGETVDGIDVGGRLFKRVV